MGGLKIKFHLLFGPDQSYKFENHLFKPLSNQVDLTDIKNLFFQARPHWHYQIQNHRYQTTNQYITMNKSKTRNTHKIKDGKNTNQLKRVIQTV